MKFVKSMLAVLAALTFAAFSLSATAVPAGKTVEWDSPMGKVVFDGKVHASKGLKCNACHTKIFKMKKGADKINMHEINEGEFCGACHNGKKAFKANDPKNCKTCHQKKK